MMYGTTNIKLKKKIYIYIYIYVHLILVTSVHTRKKNVEASIVGGKETGLEVNYDKTK